MNVSNTYNESIDELIRISKESKLLVDDLSINGVTQKCESRLDGWDYCYSIAIGLAGVYITSSKQLEEYLVDVHRAASECHGEYDLFQRVLGKLLHHKGDYIDQIAPPFKNRNGENAYGAFHRLLWGHDVLSVGEDNPFYLMFKQEGVRGIVQAVRHLLADTLSKQGLPMPGSSYLDYVKEDVKTSNYLILISQKLSEAAFDNKSRAQEIYSHMFSIRGQDLTYAGIVNVLTTIYNKTRNIKDAVRISEIRLISYYVSFWGHFIVGMSRQNGIPYVSVPLASAMFIEWVRYNRSDWQQINKMKTVTDDIERRVLQLEQRQSFIMKMIGDDYCSVNKKAGQISNINRFKELLNEVEKND